ncbi:MAG: hypothetical protein ACP5I6_00630 [Caldisphaera sp.]|nr:MAG: hypothetical protein C0172_01600 [Caldisphaera sp.]
MYSILITGEVLYTGKETIKDSYVYIRNGVIKKVGNMPIPDEIGEPSLVLGGEGKVIMPSLTAVADIASFPIKYFRPSMKKRIEFYKRMKANELFVLSFPAVYELNMQGISTIIAEALDPSYVIDLNKKIGGNYGVAIPVCVESFDVPPILVGRIKISGVDCFGEGISEDSNNYLMLISRPTYSISGFQNAYEKSENIRKEIGLKPNLIKEGNNAEIVVYDVSKPPAMMIYNSNEEDLINIYGLNARVESLIVNEDVLVDIGGHLRITEKQLKQSKSLAEKIFNSQQTQP